MYRIYKKVERKNFRNFWDVTKYLNSDIYYN